MRMLVLVPVFALLACEPVDNCTVNSTRCSGAVAQVCAADERWTEIMNCDEVSTMSGGAWECRALGEDAGHTCLPAVEDGSAQGGDR